MASAAPLFPSTKESTNYARLCRLLVDVSSDVLRVTFDSIRQPGDLGTVLGSPPAQTALNKLRKRKILNPSQWGKLYPAIKSSVSSKDFDITLLTVLLRNICGLTPPTTGWDMCPLATDLTPEADIARVKFYRNTVYGHASQAAVDHASFTTYWKEIRDTLVRLGGAPYRVAIDDLEHECLDPEMEGHYQELLKQWKMDEDIIKDKLDSMDDKLDSMDAKLDSMDAKLDSMDDNVKDMADELGRKLDEVKASVDDFKRRPAPVTAILILNTIESIAHGGAVVNLCNLPGSSQMAQAKGGSEEVLSIAPEQEHVVGVEGSDSRQTKEKQQDLPSFLNDYLRNTLNVSVRHHDLASLLITVECSSLQTLEGLWKDYSSGHLNKVAQETLVTDEVLKKFGLTEMKLKTFISEEEYEKGKQLFLENLAPSEQSPVLDGESAVARSSHVELQNTVNAPGSIVGNLTMTADSSQEMNWNKPRSELPDEDCNVHGHVKEVNDIVEALSGDRSKTVVGVLVSGIAGVGKSTVAIRASHRLKNEFGNFVKFCYLRGACKGESELREILNVCAPGHQQTSENPRHVLQNWCRSLKYELILVLDNAEDAMEDLDSFISLLKEMRKCSDGRIKFLITSRRSDIDSIKTAGLNIQAIKIGPLDLNESIEVLKDGANLTSDIEPDTQVKLNKLAELCENIPLVLRLAGPLLSEESEYSSEKLIQELEKNPTKTLDPDQKLWKAMEIAFQNLEEPLRHALVCLSVFVRSFERDAAEALLGVNCTEHLIKLKQRCLIQKQGNRYFIHLFIRSYVRQMGKSEELRPILAHSQKSFLEYYLSLILRNANKYWGKNTCKKSFNLFNEERLNLEFTLRDVGEKKIHDCRELENVVNACRQVAPYIEDSVPFTLYEHFLRGLLHFAQEQRKIVKQVEIMCLLYHESRKHGGDLLTSKDLICRAIKLHDDNCKLFEQDSLSEVFYLSHYGRYLSQDRKESKKAQSSLERAILLFEKETAEHDSTFDKGRILGQMGHNARLGKNENDIRYEEALDFYQEALRFRQTHYGEHVVTAFAHKELADCYLFKEKLDEAEKNYKEAIRILKKVERREQKEAVPIYKNFGRCYQKSGKIDKSRRKFEKGSGIADKTIEGNHKWKVWIKTYLALLLYEKYSDEVSKTDKLAEEVLQMGKKLELKEWDGKGELEEKFHKKE